MSYPHFKDRHMEKGMKDRVIKSRALFVVLAVFYMICAVLLFWFQPFVASAKEPVPGGTKNTVKVSSLDYINKKSNEKQAYEVTMIAKEGYEIIGTIFPASNGNEIVYYTIYFQQYNISTGKVENLSVGGLSDYTGYTAYYRGDELIYTNPYSMSNMKSNFTYSNAQQEIVVSFSCSGCKIFQDAESRDAYVATGSLDGMINDDVDVDSGDYDKDIGYLHDLKHKPLMYGEKDENGLYSSYDDSFTWSDYYPEYDDSYMVEVRASCEVEVKKWFGIGKSTLYNSDIRELAHGVKYKDLQYVISLADEKSVFADFLNEYMPGNSSVSDVISAATYHFDAYYFRIYRWDDETQTYKYGLWVRLTKDGTALDGSLNNTIDAGTINKDGKWEQDSSSDYGEGKKDSAIVGAGDTQEDAKNEADKKQEDKDNGIKDIDLSNTNFKELWEWFTGCLVSFWNGLGVIPDFFGRIFSFLPAPVIGFIALAIVAAIILRVIGR